MRTPAEAAKEIMFGVSDACAHTGGGGFCSTCVLEVSERVCGSLLEEARRAFARPASVELESAVQLALEVFPGSEVTR